MVLQVVPYFFCAFIMGRWLEELTFNKGNFITKGFRYLEYYIPYKAVLRGRDMAPMGDTILLFISFQTEQVAALELHLVIFFGC